MDGTGSDKTCVSEGLSLPPSPATRQAYSPANTNIQNKINENSARPRTLKRTKHLLRSNTDPPRQSSSSDEESAAGSSTWTAILVAENGHQIPSIPMFRNETSAIKSAAALSHNPSEGHMSSGQTPLRRVSMETALDKRATSPFDQKLRRRGASTSICAEHVPPANLQLEQMIPGIHPAGEELAQTDEASVLGPQHEEECMCGGGGGELLVADDTPEANANNKLRGAHTVSSRASALRYCQLRLTWLKLELRAHSLILKYRCALHLDQLDLRDPAPFNNIGALVEVARQLLRRLGDDESKGGGGAAALRARVRALRSGLMALLAKMLRENRGIIVYSLNSVTFELAQELENTETQSEMIRELEKSDKWKCAANRPEQTDTRRGRKGFWSAS